MPNTKKMSPGNVAFLLFCLVAAVWICDAINDEKHIYIKMMTSGPIFWLRAMNGRSASILISLGPRCSTAVSFGRGARSKNSPSTTTIGIGTAARIVSGA
ncbi:hypothetical protein MLD38_018424 [Melastoma candidum]|uniref:Uncharacterized protein n=1 Tax=Melastoma candidum TaxID=119954 RepID=A0ACB9QV30_9MYRT|nr:hypothetical protein MLD38_018424 [Melastoma candidum]